MEVAPKMDMIMELSGAEKIATGDQILEITRTFEEMLNNLKLRKKRKHNKLSKAGFYPTYEICFRWYCGKAEVYWRL